jgi:hypothetical protein
MLEFAAPFEEGAMFFDKRICSSTLVAQTLLSVRFALGSSVCAQGTPRDPWLPCAELLDTPCRAIDDPIRIGVPSESPWRRVEGSLSRVETARN